MATIIDVARRAQVSVKTVSRVLNDDPRVRPGNRRLVRQAMSELGYLPNAAARDLAKARSRTVGLVVPDASQVVCQELIGGVAAVLRQRQHALILCDSGGDRESQAANLRSLFERRVEGLILFRVRGPLAELDLFLRAGVPLVLVGPAAPQTGLPSIPIARSALKGALEHLLSLGHRRIGVVSFGSPGGDDAAPRHRVVWQELGIPHDPALSCVASSGDECRRAVEAMLALPDRPTALVCGNVYHLVPVALSAVTAAGLRIPGDISFVCTGDCAWAENYHPPLTVSSRSRAEHGRIAAEYIFARLAGQDAGKLLAEFRTELIVRQSCAPVPAR